MRYPNHIILDVKTSPRLDFTNWELFYSSNFGESHRYSNLINTKLSSRLKKYHKSTVKFSTKATKHFFYTPSVKAKDLAEISELKQTEYFKGLYRADIEKKPLVYRSSRPTTNPTWFLFDINFVRTGPRTAKLKYSRSPEQDIVSGGGAALLAGFIGFLISEKFGIELVDSGDFYTGFMYVVFFCFGLQPLMKGYGYTTNSEFRTKSSTGPKEKWIPRSYWLQRTHRQAPRFALLQAISTYWLTIFELILTLFYRFVTWTEVSSKFNWRNSTTLIKQSIYLTQKITGWLAFITRSGIYFNARRNFHKK